MPPWLITLMQSLGYNGPQEPSQAQLEAEQIQSVGPIRSAMEGGRAPRVWRAYGPGNRKRYMDWFNRGATGLHPEDAKSQIRQNNPRMDWFSRGVLESNVGAATATGRSRVAGPGLWEQIVDQTNDSAGYMIRQPDGSMRWSRLAPPIPRPPEPE